MLGNKSELVPVGARQLGGGIVVRTSLSKKSRTLRKLPQCPQWGLEELSYSGTRMCCLFPSLLSFLMAPPVLSPATSPFSNKLTKFSSRGQFNGKLG